MPYRFRRISYREICQKLVEANDWLRSLGIETNDTRFSRIVELNSEIADHHEIDRIPELLSTHDNLELWYAITEAKSFINVYHALQNQQSHLVPRSKLRKILEGPFFPWEEDSSIANIESRNTLFELETAAILNNAGGNITGYDDVDFDFCDIHFNVQCKRFHSEGNVSHNIRSAVDQFTTRMGTGSNIKGILSFSIDKLTGREGEILDVNSSDEINRPLDDLLNTFIHSFRDNWRNILNINIIGLIIIVHVVSIINQEDSTKLLIASRKIGFDIIPDNVLIQAHSYELIRDLGGRISSTM
jgi:hypothetical protein